MDDPLKICKSLEHSNPVLLSLRHIEDLHTGVVTIILTLDFISSSPSSLWQKLRIRAKKIKKIAQPQGNLNVNTNPTRVNFGGLNVDLLCSSGEQEHPLMTGEPKCTGFDECRWGNLWGVRSHFGRMLFVFRACAKLRSQSTESVISYSAYPRTLSSQSPFGLSIVPRLRTAWLPHREIDPHTCKLTSTVLLDLSDLWVYFADIGELRGLSWSARYQMESGIFAASPWSWDDLKAKPAILFEEVDSSLVGQPDVT
ncbi:hypothetical protein EV421DRAFT_1742818 [Armillaria borealis]|uniref:Uncharacterized protein n=1 Tax=Armillaria borealis TaxID=47425 RepID=A0AA39IY09_9AGAR|nr:hypothetical protein EV421DRAFT_1742818 [Armillaria borealis]